MIINNNIPALNTHRQLTMNNAAGQQSMEKLSSGLRINRAGDDAAGLAISEKMRGQIRGLEQATRNAQDGISLIQTAEGALNETHSILQRMRELAVQSANDTNTTADRAELQKEVDQLAEEITRIAENTEFNTQNLLGGDFSSKFHIGANEGQSIDLAIGNMSSSALNVGLQEVNDEYDSTSLDAMEAGATYTVVNFDARDIGDTGTDGDGIADAQYGLQDSDGNIVAISADGETYTQLTTAAALEDLDGSYNGTFGSDVTFDNSVTSGTVTVSEEYENADSDTVVDITATGGINISSQEDADEAITTINAAIENVSSQRSELGAVQNRLEHTINNLGTSAENLQAAESRIRDVDYAPAA